MFEAKDIQEGTRLHLIKHIDFTKDPVEVLESSEQFLTVLVNSDFTQVDLAKFSVRIGDETTDELKGLQEIKREERSETDTDEARTNEKRTIFPTDAIQMVDDIFNWLVSTYSNQITPPPNAGNLLELVLERIGDGSDKYKLREQRFYEDSSIKDKALEIARFALSFIQQKTGHKAEEAVAVGRSLGAISQAIRQDPLRAWLAPSVGELSGVFGVATAFQKTSIGVEYNLISSNPPTSVREAREVCDQFTRGIRELNADLLENRLTPEERRELQDSKFYFHTDVGDGVEAGYSLTSNAEGKNEGDKEKINAFLDFFLSRKVIERLGGPAPEPAAVAAADDDSAGEGDGESPTTQEPPTEQQLQTYRALSLRFLTEQVIILVQEFEYSQGKQSEITPENREAVAERIEELLVEFDQTQPLLESALAAITAQLQQEGFDLDTINSSYATNEWVNSELGKRFTTLLWERTHELVEKVVAYLTTPDADQEEPPPQEPPAQEPQEPPPPPEPPPTPLTRPTNPGDLYTTADGTVIDGSTPAGQRSIAEARKYESALYLTYAFSFYFDARGIASDQLRLQYPELNDLVQQAIFDTLPYDPEELRKLFGNAAARQAFFNKLQRVLYQRGFGAYQQRIYEAHLASLPAGEQAAFIETIRPIATYDLQQHFIQPVLVAEFPTPDELLGQTLKNRFDVETLVTNNKSIVDALALLYGEKADFFIQDLSRERLGLIFNLPPELIKKLSDKDLADLKLLLSSYFHCRLEELRSIAEEDIARHALIDLTAEEQQKLGNISHFNTHYTHFTKVNQVTALGDEGTLAASTNKKKLPKLGEERESRVDYLRAKFKNQKEFRELSRQLSPAERAQFFRHYGIVEPVPTPQQELVYVEQIIENTAPFEYLSTAAAAANGNYDDGQVSYQGTTRSSPRGGGFQRLRSSASSAWDRLRGRKSGGLGSRTAKKVTSQAANKVLQSGLESLGNAALSFTGVPLAGTALGKLWDGLKPFLYGKNDAQKAGSLMAFLAGGLIAAGFALYRFFTGSVGAVIGGLVGGVTGYIFGGGPVGGFAGALAGAQLGYTAEKLLAQTQANIGGLFSNGLSNLTSGLGTPTLQGALGTASSFGAIGTTAVIGYTAFTFGSAFLINTNLLGTFILDLQPTKLATRQATSESAYLTVQKTSDRSRIENDTPTDIEYSLKITPKSSENGSGPPYTIRLLSIIDKPFYSNSGVVVTPPSLTYPPGPFTEEQTITYSLAGITGTNTRLYNEAIVAFEVLSPDGSTVLESNQKLIARTSIAIGNPPDGCWPASGRITQVPFESYSHGNADAFDIAGIGKVFAPFDGELFKRPYQPKGYGNHYELHFTHEGKQMVAIFAHLKDAPTKSGFITVGTEIGTIGSTGNSTGYHLHYEIRQVSPPGIPRVSALRNLVPNGTQTGVNAHVQQNCTQL